MAAKQHKCALCDGIINSASEETRFKNRYVHITCFNANIKTITKTKNNKLVDISKERNSETNKSKTASKPKPKAELKDPVSEEDYADKKQYYQYLRGLFHDELSAKVYALSDYYVSHYSFTFKEMYQTLYYLHEIIGKELIGDVVGLIPYYLTEAQNYFKNIEHIEEINKDIDISKMYKEKVIKIKPMKRNIKQLNIENIGKGEENGS